MSLATTLTQEIDVCIYLFVSDKSELFQISYIKNCNSMIKDLREHVLFLMKYVHFI